MAKPVKELARQVLDKIEARTLAPINPKSKVKPMTRDDVIELINKKFREAFHATEAEDRRALSEELQSLFAVETLESEKPVLLTFLVTHKLSEFPICGAKAIEKQYADFKNLWKDIFINPRKAYATLKNNELTNPLVDNLNRYVQPFKLLAQIVIFSVNLTRSLPILAVSLVSGTISSIFKILDLTTNGITNALTGNGYTKALRSAYDKSKEKVIGPLRQVEVPKPESNGEYSEEINKMNLEKIHAKKIKKMATDHYFNRFRTQAVVYFNSITSADKGVNIWLSIFVLKPLQIIMAPIALSLILVSDVVSFVNNLVKSVVINTLSAAYYLTLASLNIPLGIYDGGRALAKCCAPKQVKLDSVELEDALKGAPNTSTHLLVESTTDTSEDKSIPKASDEAQLSVPNAREHSLTQFSSSDDRLQFTTPTNGSSVSLAALSKTPVPAANDTEVVLPHVAPGQFDSPLAATQQQVSTDVESVVELDGTSKAQLTVN